MTTNTQAAEALRNLLDDDGENRAVRAFLMLYGCGNPTADQMAEHMKRSGFDVVPDWVERSPGHLTKGGAQLWLRMLFDLEKAATPQQAEPELLARLRKLFPTLVEGVEVAMKREAAITAETGIPASALASAITGENGKDGTA